MAYPGFFWGGANSKRGCANVLFCKFVAENYTKMKEFGSWGGGGAPDTLFGSANAERLKEIYLFKINKILYKRHLNDIWIFQYIKNKTAQGPGVASKIFQQDASLCCMSYRKSVNIRTIPKDVQKSNVTRMSFILNTNNIIEIDVLVVYLFIYDWK